ncbi:hypothetical protein ACFL6G_10265, partial [candidate division KSB1 bacterium]
MSTKKLFCYRYLSLYQLILIGVLIYMTPSVSAASAQQLGNITSINEKDNHIVITTDDIAIVKVVFYRDDIFRIWVGPVAELTDPAGNEDTPIVVYDGDPVKVFMSEEDEYYKIESGSCVLRVYKSPCRFALYNKDNTKMIFEEESPITYGEDIPIPESSDQSTSGRRRRQPPDKIRSYQTIKRNSDDYFYGCGMQNGHFNHNDQDINISSTARWNENDHPNAVPFYMSLRGYGAFRNTYARGTYSFKEPVKLIHNENRFDCYYFYGPSLKKIIDGYTLITGRPFMTPMWAMEFGDADRYEDGTYECVSY